MAFRFKRAVHLYETDLMGVVHHSNYIRYMEEARFEWLRQENLIHLHGPDKDCVFAVIDLQGNYKAPLKWGDEFEIELTVTQSRSRFKFDAVIRVCSSQRDGKVNSSQRDGQLNTSQRDLSTNTSQRGNEGPAGDSPVFTGTVDLVCVNNKLLPIRPPKELVAFFERERQKNASRDLQR